MAVSRLLKRFWSTGDRWCVLWYEDHVFELRLYERGRLIALSALSRSGEGLRAFCRVAPPSATLAAGVTVSRLPDPAPARTPRPRLGRSHASQPSKAPLTSCVAASALIVPYSGLCTPVRHGSRAQLVRDIQLETACSFVAKGMCALRGGRDIAAVARERRRVPRRSACLHQREPMTRQWEGR